MDNISTRPASARGAQLLTWATVAALPWLLIHSVPSRAPGDLPGIGIASLFYVIAASSFSYIGMIRVQRSPPERIAGAGRLRRLFSPFEQHDQSTMGSTLVLACLLTVASHVSSQDWQHRLVFASYVLNLTISLGITRFLWRLPANLHPKANGRVAQYVAFFLLTGAVCFVCLVALRMLAFYRV